MSYRSPGPPPFNVVLTLHWPYSPFSAWDPLNQINITGSFDAWVVPTSRLNVLSHLGASARFESEFKMPIVNYYIETPQYSEYGLYGCTTPVIQADANTGSGAEPTWLIDLAMGPSVFQNDENPYETQFLVLWWERRWWGQDEYWVRAYCLGANWDYVTPLSPGQMKHKLTIEEVRARTRYGPGIRRPGERAKIVRGTA